MALTEAQLPALKASIAAQTDPTFVQYRTNGQNGLMADWYNVATSPAFIVYKKSVPTSLIGVTINYVALAAMTDANQGQLVRFTQLNPLSFDPNKADVRSFFANTFSGALGGQGQATRDAMEALYRRTATRGERIYATGTGTTADPGALVFEGNITDSDISRALQLP